MTLVTTSRKPVPQLRTLGKDLAFTLGGRYIPRGKTSLAGMLDADMVVVMVSGTRNHYLLQVFDHGEPVAEYPFSHFSVGQRDGELERGLRTGNQTVYGSLKQYLNVIHANLDPSALCFDGAQRRRYKLALKL